MGEREADEPADWTAVAADPPPEGVVVETMVRRATGGTMHLPLQLIRGRWHSVTGFPFCATREPTHWRPLP